MEMNKEFEKEVKNGIVVCYYSENFLNKAKSLEKILKFPFFYRKCDENKLVVVKNYKIIYIFYDLDLSKIKKTIFLYFDLDYNNLILSKLREDLKKGREKIKKEVEDFLNKKLEEFKRLKKYKRSYDFSLVFRILLVFFIVIFLVKLGSSFFNVVMNIIYKNKEMQFIKQLNEDVVQLLKKESNSFLLKKIELHNNIKFVCFTYPENVAKIFNLTWGFNDIEGFKFNEELERLSKKKQKNIFIVYSKGNVAYKAVFINGLYSSILEDNPLCLKNGEKFYLINYKGIVFVSKKKPSFFIEEIENLN